MFIKFDEIPGHLNLFLDYLYEFDSVKDYYKYDFRNPDSYTKMFADIASKPHAPKERVSEIIKNQYADFNPSEKTLNNILSLAAKNTFAVVTGQQLGILGGPLYTFYKIITTIKLAAYLRSVHQECNFVPVFWLAGDDHDFEEVKYIKLLDEQNKILNIAYDDDIEIDTNRGDVGSIEFKETISGFFDELEKNLRETEFKKGVVEFFKSFYKEGKTFKTSFREMIFSIFDKYGLVIFDPQEKELKQLLKHIFRSEIEDFRTHTQKLVEKSARLEEVYHAQVKIQPINLFYHDEEGRYLIEPSDNEYKLKRKRKKFTREELVNLIEETPEKFSPNVLLRPVCQDYLLPTICYVGGPSEISYFAQVMPLYKTFNVAEPIIYPRSSVTLIEKNISSIIQKYNIDVKALLRNPEEIIEKVIAAESEYAVDDIFKPVRENVENILDELQTELLKIDKTISDSAQKYKQKITYYIDELKGKTNEANKRKHEIAMKQLQKLITALYPEKNLQERELNIAYFVNKYGFEIIDRIFNELEINKFDHQLILL
jgi:bacillithiol biosynthesis cysteine-adding enzyme BshC